MLQKNERDCNIPLYPLHLFTSKKSLFPERSARFPAPQLMQFLAEHRATPRKESASLFSCVSYAEPDKECRKLAGIAAVHAVVGDIDNEFSQDLFDAGCTALRTAGLQAVAYQTFSSTPTAQRWRVVVLLDYPIVPAAYKQCWSGLNNMFGGMLDPNAKDASRLSYVASHPPGEMRASVVIGG